MAVLITDTNGNFVPQYLKVDGSAFEEIEGINGANFVSIKRNLDTISDASVVGVKTVTAMAAEIFAGSSAKANRQKLILKNEDAVLRFRIGPLSITQQNGFPVEPNAVIELYPETGVPIYAIAEGASLQVAVMEV